MTETSANARRRERHARGVSSGERSEKTPEWWSQAR
jgi:hypothetical protein